ncbi:hypothetical protein [Dyadobacter fermentans]|uniref:Uncharacterized protein n=1 Tax=Dyadobacter fermentans (strain ATCC 700827 / DSM 18053 / CIP 107007 / KCTC 52180 / NS114) TaxID=471854 RepID=C6VYL2_DYAFD|nr:hypothetical protein [Dyadobacter fermentans]ACT93367.1 hypothetical protein Dfer_2144 [Dyadobacter fermentans DSM 18053]
MEKYFNQYVISMAISLIGCLSYIIFTAIKRGVQSLQEREIAVVFFDFIAICSAVKIVYMSFDVTICRPDLKTDLAFLALGGLMMVVVALKNIVSKFKVMCSK